MKHQFTTAGILASMALFCTLNKAYPIIVGNDLVDRQYPTDNSPFVFVADFNVSQAGTLSSVLTWGQAGWSGQAGSSGHTFDTYVLHPLGGLRYLVAYDTGSLTVGGAGVNTFAVPSFGIGVGDLIAHEGQGIPLDDPRDVGVGSLTYDSLSGLHTAPTPQVGDILTFPEGRSGVGGFTAWRTYSIAFDVGDGNLDKNFPAVEGSGGGGQGGSVVPEPSTYLAGILTSLMLVGSFLRRRK